MFISDIYAAHSPSRTHLTPVLGLVPIFMSSVSFLAPMIISESNLITNYFFPDTGGSIL